MGPYPSPDRVGRRTEHFVIDPFQWPGMVTFDMESSNSRRTLVFLVKNGLID